MTKLYIGQTVLNFGMTAQVDGFHEITGDPILRHKDGTKWLADAAKCEPVDETNQILQHKDGLVSLG